LREHLGCGGKFRSPRKDVGPRKTQKAAKGKAAIEAQTAKVAQRATEITEDAEKIFRRFSAKQLDQDA
jgi:hypothetical protein